MLTIKKNTNGLYATIKVTTIDEHNNVSRKTFNEFKPTNDKHDGKRNLYKMELLNTYNALFPDAVGVVVEVEYKFCNCTLIVTDIDVESVEEWHDRSRTDNE